MSGRLLSTGGEGGLLPGGDSEAGTEEERASQRQEPQSR